MSIQSGDLVYVAENCTTHPDCGRDFGLVFRVGVTSCAVNGAQCEHCHVVVPPGTMLAQHPRAINRGPGAINDWIPFSFLKKINPPGTTAKQQEPEKETA